MTRRKKSTPYLTGKTSGGHPKTLRRRFAFIGHHGLAVALDAAAARLNANSRGKAIEQLVTDALAALGIAVVPADAKSVKPDRTGRPPKRTKPTA